MYCWMTLLVVFVEMYYGISLVVLVNVKSLVKRQRHLPERPVVCPVVMDAYPSVRFIASRLPRTATST